MKFGSNTGATFVEILVAAAILGIGSGAVYQSLVQYNSLRGRLVTASAKEVQIAGLLDNFQSNLQYFRSSSQGFVRGVQETNVADDMMPDVDSLPLAWSSNGAISTPVECPQCRGRLGYVIQPYGRELAPIPQALYLVTLKVAHPDLSGGEGVTYRFITTIKD